MGRIQTRGRRLGGDGQLEINRSPSGGILTNFLEMQNLIYDLVILSGHSTRHRSLLLPFTVTVKWFLRSRHGAVELDVVGSKPYRSCILFLTHFSVFLTY